MPRSEMTPEDTTTPVEIEPSRPASGEIHPIGKKSTAECDVESLKPGLAVQTGLGDGGAQKSELMQAVWGKHGKLWVIFGLAMCMLV